MIQLFDLCPQQTSTCLLLRYINEEQQFQQVTLSAFRDIINQLANRYTCIYTKNTTTTAADLLKPQVFHEIHYLSQKKITFVLRQQPAKSD